MPTRLGLVFVPTLPPERLRAVARACDTHLDELWVWEDCFKESGIATAAAALAWTDRVQVGLGLMPAPLRNVALAAMEVATLHRLFPGRFLPGVGHGVQDWMGQVGGRVASPLALLQEYAVALRRLLDGEEVTVAGRYVTLDRVRLDWPPPGRPPLLMGGNGPRTLDLCARLADGVLLGGGLDEEATVAACTAARAGWAAAHDDGSTPPVTQQLTAATGPDARARVDAELARWDLEPAPGNAVAGDAETVAAAVRRLGELGVTSVAIQPTEDEPDLEGFVAFLGTQVRPLLR